MFERNDPVVIRRKRRQRKEASSTGAWKVAFADFTLAMMALFMVLWIIQISDQDERNEIVQYLRGDLYSPGAMNPFDMNQSPSVIDLEGSPALQTAIISTRGHGPEKAGPAIHNRIPEGDNEANTGIGPDTNAMVPGQYDTQAQLVALARALNEIIESSSMANNVAVTLVPQGIRILIHDNIDRFMFTQGSAKIQAYFEDLLLALGPVLAQVDNAMVISGHTDSLPYSGSRYTNWELSSKRALLARRVLEFGGVRRDQVIQVTGMADKVPYILDDPAAAANRRIEILILTSTTEQLIRDMVGVPTESYEGMKNRISGAKQAAANNQPTTRYVK